MEKLIVEIGIKLQNNLLYYDKLLKQNGLQNGYNAITHDIYYTNKDLENKSEYEIKQECIRLRNSYQRTKAPRDYYDIQNMFIKGLKIDKVKIKKLDSFEKNLKKKGYRKVIDTIKIDHHYWNDKMNSRIQLQETEELGLILYYDNSNYYGYPLLEQRKMLIDELNSYGFNISYEEQGIDKLKTLYNKKEHYSLNQNTTYTWQ